MGMQNLYEQEILDHYQNPRNYGLLPHFNFISPLYNPSCGDSVTVAGLIERDTIIQIKFEGKGCVLSLAMASKLTEFAQGKTLYEVLQLNETLVFDLLHMQLGLKRLQCGLLPIQALQKGIMMHQEKVKESKI